MPLPEAQPSQDPVLLNPTGPDSSIPDNTKVIRRVEEGADGAVFTRNGESLTLFRSNIGFRIVRAGN